MIDLDDLLLRLCAVGPDRRPGSPGNHAAVELVAEQARELGWSVACPAFPVVDWAGEPGTLRVGDQVWTAHPSPYGTGWSGSAPIHAVATEAELLGQHAGAILLLHGELTTGPLTPRDYPFYGSDRDARITTALEASGAAAVVAVTGTAPEVAGAVDPYPLIEDSAFSLPVADLRASDGADLLAHLAHAGTASLATLELRAERWPATARNVLAHRGDQSDRVTVVAHLDTKPGTPGAVDNGTGVVTLLRVAELLDDLPAEARPGVELLWVNGEDSHQAAGELDYLASNDLHQVRLAINIDGAGFPGGPTAFSTYGTVPEPALAPLRDHGLVEGPSWPQSDHMVFAMAGRPAIALTSHDLDGVLAQVAHSPHDTPQRVDTALLEQAAQGIAALVRSLPEAEQ